MSELNTHIHIAKYLNAALGDRFFWTTIPAGGGGLIRGKQLKDKGYRAGVPDILLVKESRAYWIEIKVGKGTLSSKQKTLLPVLERNGMPTAVCRDIYEVEDVLKKWGFLRNN